MRQDEPMSSATEIGRPGSAAWWQDRRAARNRRRHRPGGLTIEQITKSALVIVDDEGLGALTMRRLAEELGTGAASLYRHVANREELLVEAVDHVLGEVEFGTPKPTWREDFANQASLLWSTLIAHPHLLPVVLRTPLLGPNAVAGREASLRRMLDYGFRPVDVQPIYTVIVTTALGHAAFAGAIERPGPLRPEVYAALPADEYPTVTALAERTAPQTSSALFALTIDIMLDGIETRYPREERPC